jgi:hypothetical protein
MACACLKPGGVPRAASALVIVAVRPRRGARQGEPERTRCPRAASTTCSTYTRLWSPWSCDGCLLRRAMCSVTRSSSRSAPRDPRTHPLFTSPGRIPDTLVVEPIPRSWPSCEAAGRRHVTLFWPPARSGDHNLIVDGIATAVLGGESLSVSPTRAVLHRRVPAPPEATTACGWDCIPLE